MAPIAGHGTLLQHAVATNETLGIWASALGCAPSEVTEVVRRAGLPIEKLWNSICATAHAREVH
jgi:hypothetical protein